MKYIIPIFILCLAFAFLRYNKTRNREKLAAAYENFAVSQEKMNTRIINWHRLVDSLYIISKTDVNASLDIANYLIQNDTTLSKVEISHLYYIQGDILFQVDSFNAAKMEFDTALTYFEVYPESIAKRAACYVHEKNYAKAMRDLKNAPEVYHYFDWYVGNLYEVLNQPDSANYYYQRLYKLDTLSYKYVGQRINGLRDRSTKLHDNLVFIEDSNRQYLLFKRPDPNSNGVLGNYELISE